MFYEAFMIPEKVFSNEVIFDQIFSQMYKNFMKVRFHSPGFQGSFQSQIADVCLCQQEWLGSKGFQESLRGQKNVPVVG